MKQHLDKVFIFYSVFFGAYVLNDPYTFLCSLPLFVFPYVLQSRVLYVLPVKTEEELEDFLEIADELQDFDNIKVLEASFK